MVSPITTNPSLLAYKTLLNSSASLVNYLGYNSSVQVSQQTSFIESLLNANVAVPGTLPESNGEGGELQLSGTILAALQSFDPGKVNEDPLLGLLGSGLQGAGSAKGGKGVFEGLQSNPEEAIREQLYDQFLEIATRNSQQPEGRRNPNALNLLIEAYQSAQNITAANELSLTSTVLPGDLLGGDPDTPLVV